MNYKKILKLLKKLNNQNPIEWNLKLYKYKNKTVLRVYKQIILLN